MIGLKGGFLMIYCVEDESAIRDLTVYTLKASGFEAMGFENSTGFWAAMKEQRPELIILDLMLPGEDGLTILKNLRSSPVTADIICMNWKAIQNKDPSDF